MRRSKNSPPDGHPSLQASLPLEEEHAAEDIDGRGEGDQLAEEARDRVVEWSAKSAEQFIRSVGPDTGYARKPVEAIMIRPKEGKLTVQSRRWHNVLLRNAQLNPPKLPGQRVRMSLKRFLQDARQEKANNEYLTEVLNVLLTTTIEWGDSPKKLQGKKYKWTAATLLSFASIEKDGGDAELVYDFDQDVRALMLEPDVYAKISLEAVAKMSTHAALTLYELGARYYSPKMELSSHELPWKEWVLPLSGSRERNVEKLEYKTFVRDLLKPALMDVNNPNLANIIPFTVRVEERKVGRKVEFLRIVVAPRKFEPTSTLGTAEGLQVEVEHLGLIGRLINLKVPQAEAETLYHRYGHNRVRSAIEAVERRKTGSPIDNPVSYFRKVLKSGSADETVVDVEVRQVPAAAAQPRDKGQGASGDSQLARLRQKYAETQREEMIRLFEEGTPALKAEEYARFEKTEMNKTGGPMQRAWLTFRAAPAGTTLPKFLREPFFTWMMRDSKPPDAEALLEWGARNGFLTLNVGQAGR